MCTMDSTHQYAMWTADRVTESLNHVGKARGSMMASTAQIDDPPCLVPIHPQILPVIRTFLLENFDSVPPASGTFQI